MSRYTKLTGSNWYEPLPKRFMFSTTAPVIFDIGKLGSGVTVTVPVGTEFDLSVPRFLRWLFKPYAAKYLKAACLHDYLLSQGWSRVAAGAVFHDALKADNVPLWQRLVMWLSVSLYKWS